MAFRDGLAYGDALHLLERVADPHRVAANGMTFARMLADHREILAQEKKAPPGDFEALWAWAQTHGILQQPN
jgi:hypothetical protein